MLSALLTERISVCQQFAFSVSREGAGSSGRLVAQERTEQGLVCRRLLPETVLHVLQTSL